MGADPSCSFSHKTSLLTKDCYNTNRSKWILHLEDMSMQRLAVVALTVLSIATCALCNTGGHIGRPPIPDNPRARQIFQTAEANRTADGFLTKLEMADIFQSFDINGNGAVDETEFIAHWTIMGLGDLVHAVTLFHRADTDNNGEISRNPDFDHLFYYFDRDGDGKISEPEFVTVWFSLST